MCSMWRLPWATLGDHNIYAQIQNPIATVAQLSLRQSGIVPAFCDAVSGGRVWVGEGAVCFPDYERLGKIKKAAVL